MRSLASVPNEGLCLVNVAMSTALADVSCPNILSRRATYKFVETRQSKDDDNDGGVQILNELTNTRTIGLYSLRVLLARLSQRIVQAFVTTANARP